MMTKLSMLIFQSSPIKPSLEICLVIPKEGIVILKRGLDWMSPVAKGLQLGPGTQHTLFCREMSFVASHAHMRGGSQKVTSDDEGEGGGHDTPQK